MNLIEIGLIHSPYDREGNKKPPTQGKDNIVSKIEIYKDYQDGLMKLKKGDKIQVIYWADGAKREILKSVCPGGTGEQKGVFALRSPHRPNPILITKCTIEEIDKNILTVSGLEALDKSSLIDIKIAID